MFTLEWLGRHRNIHYQHILIEFQINEVLNASRPISEELLGFSDMPPPSPSNNPAGLLCSLSWSVVHLRRKTELLTLTPTPGEEVLQSILTLAQQIDNDLSEWPGMIPITWRPVSSSASINQISYDGEADIYASLEVASVWNVYRCLRIMVNIAIFKCASTMDTVPAPYASATVCQEMVNGICASVPFHLDHHLIKHRHESSVDNPYEQRDYEDATLPDDDRVRRAIGAMYLMPRLHYILDQPLDLRNGQTEWIRGQVKSILGFFQECDASFGAKDLV